MAHTPTMTDAWLVRCNRWYRRSVPVALLLLLLSGCTLSQTAEKPNPHPSSSDSVSQWMPKWQVGNRWVYDDGYELKVTEISGDSARFVRLDAKKQWFTRQGFMVVDAFDNGLRRKMISITGSPQSFYPLKIGNSTAFTKRFREGNQEQIQQYIWKVERQEIVTVPVGTFECWVILFQGQSTQSNWRAFERWWFNPQINYYVRMDYQNGDSPAKSRKLTAFFQDQPSSPRKKR